MVALRAREADSETWAAAKQVDCNWLCAPEFAADEVVGFVKARRAAGQYIKAVTAGEGADCEGV
ncbi:MAG: hypothetical protein ACI4D1_10080, partial [Lachnospira sp.]